VLRIRGFFDPWIRDGKNAGSGMYIPDHISESLETILGIKILKFFDADPDSFLPLIRDGTFWIQDKHPESAKLKKINLKRYRKNIWEICNRNFSLRYLRE
jgi:hypothetical protein